MTGPLVTIKLFYMFKETAKTSFKDMMCSFCNTTTYSNVLKGNTQYGNDPYCCIPTYNMYIAGLFQSILLSTFIR